MVMIKLRQFMVKHLPSLWSILMRCSLILLPLQYFRSRLQALHTGPIVTHVVVAMSLVGWLVAPVICGQTVRDMVMDSTETTGNGLSIGTSKFDLV